MKNSWSLFLVLGLVAGALTSCSTGPFKSKAVSTAADKSLSEAGTTPSAPDYNPQRIDPSFVRTQADYHFTLGETYALEGSVDKAIEEYKLTLIYDPNSSIVRLKLAGEYVKRGDLVQAVDQGEEAAKLDDKMVSAHSFLGNLYTISKLYDKAISEYEKTIKLDPTNNDAPLYIGAILAEEKKFDESVAYFKKLGKTSKQPFLSFYYMGRIEQERKNDKEAEADFKKAIELKPNFLDAVSTLGALYEGQNKTDLAVKIYTAYENKNEKSSKLAYNLGRIFMERKKYGDAYKQFAIIEDMEPDNLNVKVKMALILIEQKKYQPAISKLREILVQAPESEKIRFYLAAVYEEVKSFHEAAEQFEVIQPTSTLTVKR